MTTATTEIQASTSMVQCEPLAYARIRQKEQDKIIFGLKKQVAYLEHQCQELEDFVVSLRQHGLTIQRKTASEVDTMNNTIDMLIKDNHFLTRRRKELEIEKYHLGQSLSPSSSSSSLSSSLSSSSSMADGNINEDTTTLHRLYETSHFRHASI